MGYPEDINKDWIQNLFLGLEAYRFWVPSDDTNCKRNPFSGSIKYRGWRNS